MVDLNIKIGKHLTLHNPILTASGTCGYGDELDDLLDVNLYGGLVTKSLSLNPRMGNPPPRIVETASGMINSIGLANIGVDAFLAEKAEFLQKYQGQVIVNIAGREIAEYGQVLQKLSPVRWIHGFEINVSCPNVKAGGIEFGKDPEILYQLTKRLRALTDKPLILKLSPNVTDIALLAKSCQKAGADALALINTVYGAAIDIYTRQPKINSIIGGLSGPAIKPVAVANIIKVYQAVDIPIIGIGGITSGEDVIEFILAGASAVELGSVHFFNPLAIDEILAFIKNYCQQNNISALRELIGKAEL